MRKLLFTLLTLITLQIYSQNLIAHYPFNGNTNDNSGNTLNGIDSGAVLTTDRFNNPNSAYDFNGKSYIKVPYNNLLDFDTTKDLSISLWIKANGNYNKFKFFLSYACADTNLTNAGGYQLGVDAITMPLYCEIGSSIFKNANIPDGTWHCLIFTFDRTLDSASIYNNGILISKTHINDTVSYSPACQPALYIGGERNIDTCHYFIGKIDDIKIFNKVLSYHDINHICNGDFDNGAATLSAIDNENDVLTNINETKSNIKNIKIYPNPSGGYVNVDINRDYRIKVYNVLGNLVFEDILHKNNNTINLNNKEKGIYFIKSFDLNGNLIKISKIILI